MPKFQIVEKDSYATDWAPVRYHDAAVQRFDTEEDAVKVAKDYLTDVNVNNALAAAEKQRASELFMVTDKGIFLGILDGKDWYMTDPKGNIIFTAVGFRPGDEKHVEELILKQIPTTTCLVNETDTEE